MFINLPENCNHREVVKLLIEKIPRICSSPLQIISGKYYEIGSKIIFTLKTRRN